MRKLNPTIRRWLRIGSTLFIKNVVNSYIYLFIMIATICLWAQPSGIPRPKNTVTMELEKIGEKSLRLALDNPDSLPHTHGSEGFFVRDYTRPKLSLELRIETFLKLIDLDQSALNAYIEKVSRAPLDFLDGDPVITKNSDQYRSIRKSLMSIKKFDWEILVGRRDYFSGLIVDCGRVRVSKGSEIINQYESEKIVKLDDKKAIEFSDQIYKNMDRICQSLNKTDYYLWPELRQPYTATDNSKLWIYLKNGRYSRFQDNIIYSNPRALIFKNSNGDLNALLLLSKPSDHPRTDEMVSLCMVSGLNGNPRFKILIENLELDNDHALYISSKETPKIPYLITDDFQFTLGAEGSDFFIHHLFVKGKVYAIPQALLNKKDEPINGDFEHGFNCGLKIDRFLARKTLPVQHENYVFFTTNGKNYALDAVTIQQWNIMAAKQTKTSTLNTKAKVKK